MPKTNRLQQRKEEYLKLDRRDRRRFWTDGIMNNALYILMAIFIVYTAIKNDKFLSPGSIVNIISLVAASLPMALGIAGCIVLTGTDLSGGRVVGLTAAIAGALLQDRLINRKLFANLPEITGGWIILTILIVMAVGAIIGLVNGFFVAKFSLHPFIVTLATQLITYGLILIFFMLNGNNGQPVSGLSQAYKDVVSAPLFQFTTSKGVKISLPMYVLYAIILCALMWFVWNKTAFGKNMFAVGSNADAARVSGVNVFWTTVMVHTLAGAMYGFTGFIEGARVASNTANTGLNYELDAIAACVIGGVSFVGGIGKIRGIVIGVLMLRLIFVGLLMVGVPQDLQYLIKGGIILFACALDMRNYLVKK